MLANHYISKFLFFLSLQMQILWAFFPLEIATGHPNIKHAAQTHSFGVPDQGNWRAFHSGYVYLCYDCSFEKLNSLSLTLLMGSFMLSCMVYQKISFDFLKGDEHIVLNSIMK